MNAKSRRVGHIAALALLALAGVFHMRLLTTFPSGGSGLAAYMLSRGTADRRCQAARPANFFPVHPLRQYKFGTDYVCIYVGNRAQAWQMTPRKLATHSVIINDSGIWFVALPPYKP